MINLPDPMCTQCDYNGGKCYNIFNYGGCPDPGDKTCVKCSSLNLYTSNSIQQCPWSNTKAC